MRSADRFARVRRGSAFASTSFGAWRKVRVTVIGGGALGSRLAAEIVRSGARVLVIDPDVIEVANIGTQGHDAASVGRTKVDAIVAACDAIECDRAAGLVCDVRAVGCGILAMTDLLVDCTDDPALAHPLALLSNGLSLPLVRLAVDGSGQRELGRVSVSHGGGGHACQLCTYTPADLAAGVTTPCPAGAAPRGPTLASAGTALTVVGLGLLTIQRLLAGSDAASVLDRELHVDLDGMGVHALQLARAERCLSGHEAFDAVSLPATVHDLSLRGLLQRGRDALGVNAITLTFQNAPFSLEARCGCGERKLQTRCVWAPPLTCPACGGAMRWRRDVALASIDAEQACVLRVLDEPLAALGVPDGALVTARGVGVHPARFVLSVAASPFTHRGVHP